MPSQGSVVHRVLAQSKQGMECLQSLLQQLLGGESLKHAAPDAVCLAARTIHDPVVSCCICLCCV